MPSSRRTPSARGPGRAPGSRPRSTPTGGRAEAARPRFTSRAAILTVVLAVLVVSYASSMRAYLAQRAQTADLRAQIASSERDLAALKLEKSRWADKEYVETMARKRFGWVMPGEVAYQVLDKDGKPMGSSDRLSDPDQVVRRVPTSWWAAQYSSLQQADHPPAPTKAPATKITPRDEG